MMRLLYSLFLAGAVSSSNTAHGFTVVPFCRTTGTNTAISSTVNGLPSPEDDDDSEVTMQTTLNKLYKVLETVNNVLIPLYDDPRTENDPKAVKMMRTLESFEDTLDDIKMVLDQYFSATRKDEKMHIESIFIQNDIDTHTDGAIEVDVMTTAGEKRYCYFFTPEGMSACGDWIKGTKIRFHFGCSNVILVSEISESIVEAALRDLEEQGEIKRCTEFFGHRIID